MSVSFCDSSKDGCHWWLVHQCSSAQALGTGGQATSGTRFARPIHRTTRSASVARFCILVAVGWASLVVVGCPSSGGIGQVSSTTIPIDVDADDGHFDLEVGTFQTLQLAVDITDQLPSASVASGTIALRAASLAASGVDVGGDTPVVDVIVYVAPTGTDDACIDGSVAAQFSVTLDSAGNQTITPTIESLDSTSRDTVLDGQFEICYDLESGSSVSMDIEGIDLTLTSVSSGGSGCGAFETDMAPSCSDVLADDAVLNALDTLESNGFFFEIHTGANPTDIAGDWDFTRTILFDPDDTNTDSVTSGTFTFRNQTGGSITQVIGTAELVQTVQGSGSAATLCSFARSGDSACDQSVVGISSYAVSEDENALSGSFLSVVVCRQGSSTSDCGDAGDFVFGTIEATRTGTTLPVVRVVSAGTVDLPSGMVPEWLVLQSDGSAGVVAGSIDELVVFDTLFTADVVEVALPLETTFGFGGIGVTDDGTRFGVVADGFARLLVFDAADNRIIRQSSSPGFTIGGGVFDFSPDGDLAYLVSPHSGASDAIVALATSEGADFEAGDADRTATPSAQTPNTARLSPDGTQLAVLMTGDSDVGTSSLLAFLDLTSSPPEFGSLIDVRGLSGGRVLNGELVYSIDGSRVFLAGEAGLVSVETDTPHTVTTVDVAGGSGDPAVSVAVSGDGNVVVVGIDAFAGNTDLAIVNSDTLTVLHRTSLDGLSASVRWVAHFENGRAAIVASDHGPSVVALQTIAPYTILDNFEVDAAGDSATLGRPAAGGDMIAIVNQDEPAVYLFGLDSQEGVLEGL
ncbi:MAG: hypothetical protein IID37_16910 [Planctomycetes bacterium]|nr:hypothetical protein [Planctomycetota bacterium]